MAGIIDPRGELRLMQDTVEQIQHRCFGRRLTLDLLQLCGIPL